MARKRMIDPRFLESQTLGKLPIEGRFFFLGMILLADDAGIVTGNTTFLRNSVFPYDNIRSVNDSQVEKWLEYLEQQESIYRYTDNVGNKYIILLNWFKYQSLDRPSPSKVKIEFDEDSTNNRRMLDEWSTNYHRIFDEGSILNEKKRIEEKRREKKRRSFDEDSSNDQGGGGFNFEEKMDDLRSLVDEYDLEWSESIGRKIFSLALSEDDLRDAFCITQEKHKDLKYALGILERKKKEAEAVEAEEEKRQKYHEAELEKQKVMMQEWQENSLSPEENIGRLQAMISGLVEKTAMPVEQNASVSF